MKSIDDSVVNGILLHALKDVRQIYRGCSPAFAQWLQQPSAAYVIGRSDEQLLSEDIATQLAHDEKLVLRDAIPSVAISPKPNHSRLLRLPLTSGEQVQGVDLVVVEESRLAKQLWRYYFPPWALNDAQLGGVFKVFAQGGLLFSSIEPAHASNDEALIRDVTSQLPKNAQQWLATGTEIQTDSRCGQLELAIDSAGASHLLWCLLYWGSEPCLAVSLSSRSETKTTAKTAALSGSTNNDYQSLLDASANGLMVLKAGRPVWVNSSAARLLGFNDTAQLQQHEGFVDLLPRELNSLLVADDCDAVPELQQYEGLWRTRSGGNLFIVSHWQQIQWQGQSCCYVSLVDISHRHRAELTQARNQRRFQDFAELAADFFWELDTSLRFSFVSHRFENILQIAPQNVLGLSIRQFYERYFPQPAPPHWRRHLQALSEHKTQREFEYRWTRADGKERVIVHTCQPIFDEQGIFEGYRGVGRDVTHDRALAAQVQFHATHDALTGLVNRREFERLLEEALQDADTSKQQHVLCYVDLDNFKIVNDSCGHSAGDELLRQLGDLFRERVRQSDVVARLGGDEFGILIYSCSMDQAIELAEKIRQSVMQFEFLWENKRFSIGASIGISNIVAESSSVNEVMRSADSACYVSKERGRNQVTMSAEETGVRRTDADRVIQVGSMLDEGKFKLWRQPILSLGQSHNKSEGEYFEILLRLLEPDGSLVSPATIMPAVERYGLCSKLDRVVFDRSLNWIVESRDQLDRLAMCSINLSGPSLLDRDLVEHIDEEIKRSGIPPEKICFELSETAAIAHLSSARAVIDKLGKTGCKFALDDFGSGVSSFTFLRDLPINFIKIDGSFVTRMLADPVCGEMVRSINSVSHVLNCKTVAESVEDARTLHALHTLGVDFAQGYHIGRPEPIDF